MSSFQQLYFREPQLVCGVQADAHSKELPFIIFYYDEKGAWHTYTATRNAERVEARKALLQKAMHQHQESKRESLLTALSGSVRTAHSSSLHVCLYAAHSLSL